MSAALSTIHESAVSLLPSGLATTSYSSVPPPANSEQTTPPQIPSSDLAIDVLTRLSVLSLRSDVFQKPNHAGKADPSAAEARIMAAFDVAVVQVQQQWADRVAELEEENQQLYEHIQVQDRLAQLAKDRFEARLAKVEAEHERARVEWEAEWKAEWRRLGGVGGTSSNAKLDGEEMTVERVPAGMRPQKKRRVTWHNGGRHRDDER